MPSFDYARTEYTMAKIYNQEMWNDVTNFLIVFFMILYLFQWQVIVYHVTWYTRSPFENFGSNFTENQKLFQILDSISC